MVRGEIRGQMRTRDVGKRSNGHVHFVGGVKKKKLTRSPPKVSASETGRGVQKRVPKRGNDRKENVDLTGKPTRGQRRQFGKRNRVQRQLSFQRGRGKSFVGGGKGKLKGIKDNPTG